MSDDSATLAQPGPGRWSRLRPTAGMAGLVAGGGVVGTLARAGLETAFPAPPHGWPWTTLMINLTGSFLLGLLLELLTRSGPDAGWRRAARLACGTGVIGGFTTYSTFALEAVDLTGNGHLGLALGYVAVSLVAGVLAAIAGILVGRTAAARSERRAGGAS